MTEHRFVELRTDWDANPRTYQGICTCGPVNTPAADKEDAWAELADHIVSNNAELAALREQSHIRKILRRLMS